MALTGAERQRRFRSRFSNAKKEEVLNKNRIRSAKSWQNMKQNTSPDELRRLQRERKQRWRQRKKESKTLATAEKIEEESLDHKDIFKISISEAEDDTIDTSVFEDAEESQVSVTPVASTWRKTCNVDGLSTYVSPFAYLSSEEWLKEFHQIQLKTFE